METAREELDRIKETWGLSTDIELAEKLKTNKSNIDSWIKRNKIPEKWVLIIRQMSKENRTNKIKIEKNNSSTTVNIPYFEDTYGAMGSGGLSYDNQPTVMSFDVNFLKGILGIAEFKNLHIINAVGDSMTPTIISGELLFINPFANEDNIIKDKGVYVILSTNGVLVKRIKIHPTKKEWILVSDNPCDADIALSGDEVEACTIIGRVVGHFDRI